MDHLRCVSSRGRGIAKSGLSPSCFSLSMPSRAMYKIHLCQGLLKIDDRAVTLLRRAYFSLLRLAPRHVYGSSQTNRSKQAWSRTSVWSLLANLRASCIPVGLPAGSSVAKSKYSLRKDVVRCDISFIERDNLMEGQRDIAVRIYWWDIPRSSDSTILQWILL